MEAIKLTAVAMCEQIQPSLQIPTLQQSIWKSAPTAEQLADPENVFVLAWKTNKAMSEMGLSEVTVRHYTNEGLAIIVKRHYAIGTDQFSDAILDRVVGEKRIQYEQGQITRTPYQNLRKATYWIREMHNTGSITMGKIPNWGQREPIEPFAALLQGFCTEAIHTMSETSITVAKSAIRQFLFEMEDRGFNSLLEFSQANVNDCVTGFAAHYAAGLGSAIYSIRVFLQFMFKNGLTAIDLSLSLPELVAARTMFHEGFSEDEIKRLLDQPDRTTSIGKRDYAMMVLAAQSGLRACDMVRLERSSIDWRTREIRLVQHKTGRPLSLPLEPESGNAIADYILNGRPNSTLTNIFLCHSGVIRPLAARYASAIVSKYMELAGDFCQPSCISRAASNLRDKATAKWSIL